MRLPEQIAITLPGGVPHVFRRIVDVGEVAEFRMGQRTSYADQEPAHRVRLTRPFFLGIFPVTQRQYRALAGMCPDKLSALDGNMGPDPSHFKGDELPVEQVSRDDGMAVCEALSESGLLACPELPGEWKADLPTEAQWEYGCRSAPGPDGAPILTDTDYSSGDGEAALAEIGWFEGNSGSATHPVGAKDRPNGFGLHDMHGNVWEWCRDAWDTHAYRKSADGVRDPETWATDESSQRVVRGGSWNDAARRCRSAFRVRWRPGDRDWVLGFRLLLAPVSGGTTSQSSRP